MRLLFIADGRSPIALNWIRYFVDAGHEVHLASTFACEPDLALASWQVIPVAFSGLKRAIQPQARSSAPVWGSAAVRARTLARQWLGPFTLARAAKKLQRMLEQVQPDLVHAMRIPYEGMLASLAKPSAPFLISIWGNDFTLHAPSNPWMAYYTRQAMVAATALHADCHRDVALAFRWGFPQNRPVVVLPGAGGVQPEIFYPPHELTLAPGTPYQVINPRGIRAYIRNDTFFKSIPEVVKALPGTHFYCTSMAGDPQAQRWLDKFALHEQVSLLPHQSRQQMAELFRKCQVAVSPSTHDGTPNTLLEAMACGCFPVAGDLPSLREWITPGENGLLIDPDDAPALAAATIQALEDHRLRQQAAEINTRLVSERAEYRRVMAQAAEFYQRLSARD